MATAQQALNTHPPERSNYTPVHKSQHLDFAQKLFVNRERRSTHYQQEEIPRRLDPQPLSKPCVRRSNAKHLALKQRGKTVATFSHDCCGGTHLAQRRGSGDDDSQRDFEHCTSADGTPGANLPGIAREVPGGVCAEPTARAAFLRERSEEGGEEGREEGREEDRESLSYPQQGFSGLDGTQDESEALSRNGGLKPATGSVSVKDRVAALEAKGKEAESESIVRTPLSRENAAKAASKATTQHLIAPQVVYPLHYKRFMRRTSSGTPVRPETPIYRSTVDATPVIHAPRPTRSITIIRTPPDTLPNPKPSLNCLKPSRDASVILTRQSHRHQASGISPAAFLHGTRSHCFRHGRHHPPTRFARPKKFTGTKGMVAKGRNGAYIPIGHTIRRQVEATSPWATPTKQSLTSRADANGVHDSDACPDCIQELDIKRRELYKNSMQSVKMPPSDPKWIVDPSFEQPADSQSSRNFSNMTQDSEGEDVVVTKDLGDGLDAVIVEHHGDLRRVVLNSRHGEPTIDTMQRLSSELARVSHSIAFTGAAPTSVIKHAHSKNLPVMLEAISDPKDTKTHSVPELLDMIDQAANEIHTSTGKIAEHYVSRRDFGMDDRHSLLSGSEFEDVVHEDQWPNQGLVGRQSIDEQYRTLHEMLSNAQSEGTGQPATKTATVVQEQVNTAKPTTTGDTKPPTSPQPAQSASKPTDDIPKILTTKPTLPPTAPQKSQDVFPAQTPPPEHPSLHHTPELSDAMEKPSATPSTTTLPKPSPTHHHNLFSNLLNPFHHTKASQPATPTRLTPANNPTPAEPIPAMQTPAQPTQPTVAPTPTDPPAPPRQDSPASTTPQPITTHPNPYHHAPHTPSDAAHAAYPDPKVREQQAVIRAAMRMEREMSVQNAAAVAAAVEREGRRRSLAERGRGVTGVEGGKGAPAAASGASAAVKGRRGWFS